MTVRFNSLYRTVIGLNKPLFDKHYKNSLILDGDLNGLPFFFYFYGRANTTQRTALPGTNYIHNIKEMLIMNISVNVVKSIVKELEHNPRTANIVKASTPEVEVEHLDHVLRIAIKNSEDRIQEVSSYRVKRSERAQISKFQALREKLNLI